MQWTKSRALSSLGRWSNRQRIYSHLQTIRILDFTLSAFLKVTRKKETHTDIKNIFYTKTFNP